MIALELRKELFYALNIRKGYFLWTSISWISYFVYRILDSFPRYVHRYLRSVHFCTPKFSINV